MECDPLVGFWAGTMPISGIGRFRRHLRIKCCDKVGKKESDISISNGLAWIWKQGVIFIIDTPT